MKRTLIKNTIQRQGKKVLIKGWVTAVREHGGVNFLDVRDWTGTIQAVLRPENNNNNNNNGNGNGLKKRGYQSSIISHQSPALPAEWDVVEISGEIAKRPEKMVNPNLPTGQIELKVSSLKILSQAKPSPIPLNTEGYEVAEEKRLKYRYLDLRRPRLQENLKTRQQVKQAASEFLINQGFLEVTTPLLTKSTPEGARDFVVPSRLQPGKFYALPQSPQQYKQLLMVSGIEKYFQFPEVFRDEDLRADRLLEHTQLDIEMAFASQKAILDLVEQLVIYITQEVLGKKIKERVPRPNQTAQGPGRFPRLPYQQAIEKYKTDRPDLRTAQEKKDKRIMAYVWITDFPMFEKLIGTEVAKEASDIVLLDDSFTSIERAVHWGRALYENIRKFLQFQLTINASALAIAFLSPLLNIFLKPLLGIELLDRPLTVLQLLCINLIMDTLAVLALVLEPPTPDLMERPPRGRGESFITSTMASNILVMAGYFTIALIVLQLFNFLGEGPLRSAEHISVLFTTYVLFQVFNEFNCRSLDPWRSALTGLRQSRSFWAIIVVTIVVQIVLTQAGGAIGEAFDTVPLSLGTWVKIVVFTSTALIIGELMRLVRRRRFQPLTTQAS